MIIDLLKSLLSSKKFVATIIGMIVTLVGKIGWDIDEATITKLVTLVVGYVVGQGIADNGKEAAHVNAVAAERERQNGNRAAGFVDPRLLLGIVFATLLFMPLAGCSSTSAGRAAQGALEPYSFHVVGNIDGQVAFNSRFLAVDATVDILVEFKHEGAVVWSRSFSKESGPRAYEVVFNDDGPDVVAVEFARAIASLRPQKTLPD